MRKITDFIVRCRYFFLIAFIIMAVAGLYLSTKVNINEDIMKYLPKTSETKIGKDIMDSVSMRYHNIFFYLWRKCTIGNDSIHYRCNLTYLLC